MPNREEKYLQSLQFPKQVSSHPEWEFGFFFLINMRVLKREIFSTWLLVFTINAARSHVLTGSTFSDLCDNLFYWELWQNLVISDGWDVTSEQILTCELLKQGAHLLSNIFISTLLYYIFKALPDKSQVYTLKFGQHDRYQLKGWIAFLIFFFYDLDVPIKLLASFPQFACWTESKLNWGSNFFPGAEVGRRAAF